jgi:folate-binding Fe-S cluster repair protein YgfZ
MIIESCKNRHVIKISGTDRVSFLDRLVTNSIIDANLIYSALLTPQGKYLSDFFYFMS